MRKFVKKDSKKPSSRSKPNKYQFLFFWQNSYICFSLYLVVLFVLVTAILLTLPRFINLTENKLLVSSFGTGENQPKVLGVESRKLVTKITDLGTYPPVFSAGAVLAQDTTTGEILFEKNIHSRLSPASTTKIMTALVALNYFKPADVLTVCQNCLAGGSNMGLSIGEALSFRSLLYGMLLNSGNDAAYTIAQNFPGGILSFVDKMNQEAKKLGLSNTHFENPAGFDGNSHYSSAWDLSVLAKEAMARPDLARIVATKETVVSAWDKSETINSVTKSKYHLVNLNKLLSEDGVIGIKTGFTEKAGENLVGLVERSGRRILTVILNSSNRFAETKDLINWVYGNFSWEESFE